jgi:hypothetical protein
MAGFGAWGHWTSVCECVGVCCERARAATRPVSAERQFKAKCYHSTRKTPDRLNKDAVSTKNRITKTKCEFGACVF